MIQKSKKNYLSLFSSSLAIVTTALIIRCSFLHSYPTPCIWTREAFRLRGFLKYGIISGLYFWLLQWEANTFQGQKQLLSSTWLKSWYYLWQRAWYWSAFNSSRYFLYCWEIKLDNHSNGDLAVKKFKALSAPQAHAAGYGCHPFACTAVVLHCQFSKSGKHRSPWKGLKENWFESMILHVQFSGPRNSCWQQWEYGTLQHKDKSRRCRLWKYTLNQHVVKQYIYQ